jgi:hypothetical protein
MTKSRILLLTLTLILQSALMGCGGSEAQPQALQVTQLRAAQLKAVTSETWKQRTYVVLSQDEWLRAWATRGTDVAVYCGSAGLYFCPRATDAQMPTDIDFSKYTLVGMYTPISGNQVLSLESVIQENQVIKVQTRLSSGLNIQPYFWYPASFLQASWNFFLIPATTLAIEFEQKSDMFVPFKEVSARWFHLLFNQFDERGILKGGNEFNSEGLLIGAGTAAPATFVVDNEADWFATWKRLHPGFYQPGLPDIPLIDFNKDMFVGLSFGSGPNGGYGLRIINVTVDKNEIKVFYLRSVPSAGLAYTQAVVDLSQYITIPKSTLPVKFINYVVGQPI